MTAINEFGGITYMVQGLTFGGVKASGYGRMNGREGLRSMCNIKAVVDDRFPLPRANKHLPRRCRRLRPLQRRHRSALRQGRRAAAGAASTRLISRK